MIIIDAAMNMMTYDNEDYHGTLITLNLGDFSRLFAVTTLPLVFDFLS